MKKLLIITLLSITSLTALCQGGYIKTGSIGTAKPETKKEDSFLYGPVKFRELSETIGERYLVLPIKETDKNYYFLYKGDIADSEHALPGAEGAGKLLILNNIDKDNQHLFHFKDSLGLTYTSETAKNGHLYDMIPAYDIDESRKMFLNKTLWMYADEIKVYDEKTKKISKINNLRFEPVKVVDIVAGFSSCPVKFILQTSKNEIGYVDVIVSGTNSDPYFLLQFTFDKIFFSNDPKVTYKFTPAMWAKIKDHKIEIGMTKDQVRLSHGRPDKINNGTVAGTADQWVYGDSYFYFRNGKLSSTQNYY